MTGITNATKANVLIQALPYIQKYYNKIVVVKYGGNAMIDENLKQAVMDDIVLLSLIGVKVVLVHGGGPEITETMNRMGLESRFINGLRYTDEEAVKVVQMVLSGKTNKDLVGLLGRSGGKAVGVCGVDGQMILADKLIPRTARIWALWAISARSTPESSATSSSRAISPSSPPWAATRTAMSTTSTPIPPPPVSRRSLAPWC
jgi:hypothetical protein